MKNAIDREIPDEVKGRKLRPFQGNDGYLPENRFIPATRMRSHSSSFVRQKKKVLSSLKEALVKVGLKDGMTLSFHHHFRGGDNLMNHAFEIIQKMGVKDLTVNASSVQPVHSPLIPLMESKVITNIEGGANGAPGEAISRGKLDGLLTVRSHGGRARAIDSGDSHIDIAIIGAPTADFMGNLNGTNGRYACGPLGYAWPDARMADNVIAVTNELVSFPNYPVSIPMTLVDWVVHTDVPIGDPKGIVSGTTRITKDPMRLKIASTVIDVLDSAGIIKEGLTFQSGAGGISLASSYFLMEEMLKKKIKGSWAMGGSTAALVDMLDRGLFDYLLDVQAFDVTAVNSLRNNPRHIEIGASCYASPFNAACAVNLLDTIVLGATEVDLNFNANTVTESDGRILHGIGGHQDTSSGAELSILAFPLIRGRVSVVVDNVTTVVTPGESIDVVVTERGVAVNPSSKHFDEITNNKRLNIKSMEELKNEALKLTGPRKPIRFKDNIVGVIENRDGTVLDVIYELAD